MVDTRVTAFRYRAVGKDGAASTGVLSATTEHAATSALESRGLLVVDLVPSTAAMAGSRASTVEMAIVFRSLASLVGSGIPLARALKATVPLAGRKLRLPLEGVVSDLAEGRTLSAALKEMGVMMPEAVLGIIAAGEGAGQLGPALDSAATHLEREADLRNRIRQALAYPALLVLTGILSLGVIGLVVMPRFASLLRDADQPLPTSTRLLLGISENLGRFGPALVPLLTLLLLVATRALRRPETRAAVHRSLLMLPVIGGIRHGLAAARFGQTLGGLLSTGAPLLRALDIAGPGVGDAAVSERIARARDRVAEGHGLAPALTEVEALPPLALQLIAIGESSGNLASMILKAGEVSAREAERRVATAVALLEPTIILFFGGGVALVALSIFQAIYAIRPL